MNKNSDVLSYHVQIYYRVEYNYNYLKQNLTLQMCLLAECTSCRTSGCSIYSHQKEKREYSIILFLHS